MRDDPVIALAAKFGPILKAAFPNEHSVTRFQVANALAEAAHPLPEQPQEGDAAAEIAFLKQRLESAEGVIEDCHQLLQCVEQTSSNVWWVNADDPETAVCDTFGKVEEFLKDERMVTCHIVLQEQEKQNG